MTDFKDRLLKQKKLTEMQYVVSLFSDRDLYDEYKIPSEHITNSHWRFYYRMLEDMIDKMNINKIDEMNVDLYVQGRNDKFQKFYKNCGGYDTIQEAIDIIETANIGTYYHEVLRYSAIWKLYKAGFEVEDNWEDIESLTYEELTNYYEGMLDEIFSNIDMGQDKVFDIKSDVRTMIKRADEGVLRGLPVASRALNAKTNGMALGNITMVGGMSGVGKTFFTLNQLLPSVIKEGEKILIMCNEEDMGKWQQEIVTWVINNKFDKHFVKSRFYQGDFSNDEKRLLKKSVEWLEEHIEDGLINFVNFSMYSMDKAIRLIRKYATQFDTKYFIIDTLKLDNDIGSTVTENSWLQLQQNMVKLYNVIKPSENNLHVWVTYQLNKTMKNRYLDQSALGMSKNVADVVSTLILLRDVLESEKGAKGISVKDKHTIEKLSEDRQYMIAFLDKNRQGSTHEQVVWEVDKGRNVMKDKGYARISQDY